MVPVFRSASPVAAASVTEAARTGRERPLAIIARPGLLQPERPTATAIGVPARKSGRPCFRLLLNLDVAFGQLVASPLCGPPLNGQGSCMSSRLTWAERY